MTTPLLCLLAFTAWTLGLVLVVIGPFRVGNVLLGRARANSFTPAVPHGPDWYQRAMRAHANCVENLPVFGALVLVGHVVGVRDGLFATLAMVVMGARVCQTAAHLSSGRSRVVNIRFGFFLTQVCAMMVMLGLLLLSGR